MIERKFIIQSEEGLHARPAAILVKALSKFDSTITLDYKGKSVNLKSILGVMSLGIPKGAEVSIKVEGETAQETMDSILEIFQNEGIGV